MQKIVALLLVFLTFSGLVGFAECECDSGPCTDDALCKFKERTFTVPLGSIVSIVAALIEKSIPPGASLLIPGFEIRLSQSINGWAWASCPSLCCEGERGLTMFVDLQLYGTGTSRK